MIYLTNLDLNQNQLMNAVLQPLASAPAAPKLGQIYCNSATAKIMWYNGTAWQTVGVVVENSSTNGNIKVDGVEMAVYTLPAATASVLGGIKVGTGLSVTADGTLSTAGEANQNAFSNVSVPVQSTVATGTSGASSAVTIAADSKTDTLSVASGNKWVTVAGDATNDKITIGHAASGVTAGTYGSQSKVPSVTVDAAGHITGVTETTISGVAAESHSHGNISNTGTLPGKSLVVVTDASGVITTDSSVSLTELEYLDGATSNIQTQINAKLDASQKNAANGVCPLGADKLVPSANLPSYVDDVLEAYIVPASTAYSSGWLSLTDGGAALTPEKGKIYVVVSAGDYLNKQYRWGGTTYALCNPSDVNKVNGKTGIVVLTQDDVGDGSTYVRYSSSEKTKLSGIASGATNNTITLNGTANQNPSFYAPAGVGTSGQILKSNGSGAPTWESYSGLDKVGTVTSVGITAGTGISISGSPVTSSGTMTVTNTGVTSVNGSTGPITGVAKKYTATNPALTASGGAWSWAISNATHGLGNAALMVQVYEVSSGAMVFTDVTIDQSTFTVTITMIDSASAGTLAAETYRAVIIG
jgi:hypothetical protein